MESPITLWLIWGFTHSTSCGSLLSKHSPWIMIVFKKKPIKSSALFWIMLLILSHNEFKEFTSLLHTFLSPAIIIAWFLNTYMYSWRATGFPNFRPITMVQFDWLKVWKAGAPVLLKNLQFRQLTMRRNLPKTFSVLKFWINLLNFSLKNFWQTVKKLIFAYFY